YELDENNNVILTVTSLPANVAVILADADDTNGGGSTHTHSYGDPTFTWAEDYSSATAAFTCTSGDDIQTVDATVTSATTAATCTVGGATVYTAAVTFNGETYTDTMTVAIAATGHNYVGSAVKTEPTCTENGSYVITVACTECDDELYTYTYTIPATGHTWDEGTETVAATRYTQGMTTYTCTVCGETKTEYINKVNATFLFDDVLDDSQYYFIPVYWAYDLGITAGTSDTLFSPSQGCTRAEFVTFLYRLAQATGVDTSTESDSTAFTDVDSDDYFYEAVLWAAENGITSGTSDTTFTPNRPITRREAIAMLYRYECAANGEPSVNENNPFNDVTTDDYAYAAILWAVEQGITSGTGDTTFSPANTCTRAMMVTFLYNYAAIQD
ncbi:MAG: S-layer homology domain-containing protein, partial [Oscillospiraceae bacterium]|nr:S-layer homology domain-containing protein [Oscillospiraceae bacterium]